MMARPSPALAWVACAVAAAKGGPGCSATAAKATAPSSIAASSRDARSGWASSSAAKAPSAGEW